MALLMNGKLRSVCVTEERKNDRTGELYSASAITQVETSDKLGDGMRLTLHTFYLDHVNDAKPLRSLIGQEVVCAVDARIDRRTNTQKFYLNHDAGGIRPAGKAA